MTDQNSLNVTIRARNEAKAELEALRFQLRSVATDFERLSYMRGPDIVARQLNNLTSKFALLKSNLDVMNESIAKGLEAPALKAAQAMEVLGEQTANSLRRGFTSAAASSNIFSREIRHVVALFDELASGRRGQFIGSLGASLRDSGAGASALALGMGAVVAALGGISVLRKVEDLSKWAEQTKAASEATGLSVEQFSKLQGAFALTGMKASNAQTAMRNFAKSVEEAGANPASRAAKAFQSLGISLDFIRGHVNDAMGAFEGFTKAWNENQNTAVRAAAGQAIFRQSIEEITPLLSRNVDGIHQLMNTAQQLGITLDEKTAQALIHTGDSVNELGQRIRGAGIQSMVSWLPVIDDVIKDLDSLVSTIGSVSGALGGLASSINKILAPMGGIASAVRGAILPWTMFRDAMNLGVSKAPMAEANLPPVDVHAKRLATPFDIPKGHTGIDKGITSDIAALRTSLQGLRRDYQLAAEQQDALFIHARLQARVARGDRDISPMAQAKLDYSAYREAGQQKLGALAELQSKTDAVYDQIIAKAQEVYAKDPKLYKEAVQQKINADKEFLVEHQRIQNQVDQHLVEIVDAHKRAVDEVINKWGSAFDQIGSKIEDTIGQAIKSAFQPMKPEYWYTSSTGPGGQPLMHAHRINPTTQLLGGLATSAAQDLGKSLLSSVGTSLAKSIFGEGTTSFGSGIAKLIGIGTPGGLFGTGLGAVSGIGNITQQAATTANTTALAALTTAVAANTAALTGAAATSAASTGGSALSAAGSAGGIFSGAKSLFSFLPGFARGGIVPSAAGGWALGSFPGSTPALLHQREMVLPEHLSTGLQNLINSGGGNNFHAHFHGPADAPSISRWFKENVSRNSAAIRDMFHNNALTPRSL